ncbi:tumor necrosis factor receptor superfamily member 10B [Protobothrops mucrosquamatus]|uniref:tumor necrosis factor receptor superfamily member 10B n=1 Tax=Protobothrops mucrosquamatus TaxID=103944 RepID=UPI0007759332|nr:tumor necrosis factor receptor superfamily member 10B [Protobothrops mucrosquamatus]
MAVAVVTRLAVLALLSKVESPSLRNSCEPGEFLYSGICCKHCPAGTHVEEYCSSPHTQGICKHCTDGEDYTEYDNGLVKCLPCEECKSGYKMITPCTRKKNTECQCNDGYFCPQGCEECMKCKKRCPEGEVIVEHCNATTDTICGLPHAGASGSSFTWLYIFIGIGTGISVVVLLVWILYTGIWRKCKPVMGSPPIWRKCKPVMKKASLEKEKSTDHLIPGNENVNSTTEAPAASEDRLSEAAERENLEMGNREQDSVLPDRPSVSSLREVACSNGQSSGRNDVRRPNKPAVRIKSSPMKTLEDIYFQIKDTLGPNYWRPLMRKCGFLDNDIDNIILDNAQNVDEQHYQLLKTLRDRNGVVAAFQKIFAGLEEMNLYGIYENLINELKSKDLIIMEAED